MQKILTFVSIILLAVSLPACGQSRSDFNEITAQVVSYEELNKKYVRPIYLSRVSLSDWDRADEVEPDLLVAYYVYLMNYEMDLHEYYNTLEVNDNFDPIAPAGEVENAVLAHFDVSAEYLRQADSYDAAKETYSLFGIGGLSRCEVVSAEQGYDKITLQYESYQDDTLNGEGTVEIKLDKEDGYLYDSCRFTAIQENETALSEAGDQRIVYTEDEMPHNSPEDLVYVNRYISPYVTTGLFMYNFSSDDMSELYNLQGNLLTIFNAFALKRPDNDLSLTDEEITLDQEIIEDILLSHLDLSPEKIREASAEYYDGDNGTYTRAYGLGGGPGEYVVTNSRMEDGILTLEYDSYRGDNENPTDTFRYAMYQKGVLVIEINGDDFRYLSNTVQNAPGIYD